VGSDVKDLYDEQDATGLAAAIRAGEVSPREVVEFAIARLDERNESINAVVARRDAAALAEADSALPDGPLTGVPFVVKDLGMPVAGLPATNGSRLFAGEIATHDGELLRRYRRAGVVVIGTTNSPELGRNASTEPLLFGPTRNPWSLSHSAGGSSGGTAAAVAAGIVPAGHGNDGGGSIRIPASECGLVGLKPSRGRTPALPRRSAMAYPLGINHVLTRSVRDTALFLDVGAGPVPGDPYVIAPPARPFADEVGAAPGRRRVAVSVTTPSGDPVDTDCAAVVRDVATLLGELGHEVSDAAPEYPLDAISTAMQVFMAAPLVVEVDARLDALGRALRDDDLEPLTRQIYERGRTLSATDVVIAHQELERASHIIGGFFETYDLLLTATIARPVPPLGYLDTTDPAAMRERGAVFAALTGPFNVTGQPAISLPLGHDRDGLPVGVQLVAGFGREDLLLRVAAQLEEGRPWSTRPVWPPRD
jgi:amidase